MNFKDPEIQNFPGKISVIIPVYNESMHILSNIRETNRVLESFGCKYEIIIVDDGSDDDTFSIIELGFRDIENIYIFRSEKNEGKGWALRKGFKFTTGDLVVFLDADLEIHPKQIKEFYEIMVKEKADIVIGSKRHPKSHVNYPLYRKIISYIYFFIVRILFNLRVKDTQTGFKLIKREVLDSVLPKLLEKRYALDLEFLINAKQEGYKIVEAPVRINFKRRFRRIKLSDIYRTGLDTLAIFYRWKILKFYDRKIAKIKKFPRVSIIIPVKNKNKYLVECLDHCLALDYPNFEIIVLSDKEFELFNSSKRIKVVPTGSVSPPRKRDIGLQHASGEILAFLDSDAFPEKDWLRNGVINFENNEVVAVGGPALTPSNDDFWQKASGDVYNSFLVSGKYRYRYRIGKYLEVDDYPSCNFFVRKSEMEKVGGFNTDFWPGDDTFFCLKLIKRLKKRIVYDPKVIVYHHRRRLFCEHLKQIKNYALHRGYFAKRFPETSFRLSYFFPTLFLVGLSVGWIFGFFYPIFYSIYLSVIGVYLLFGLVPWLLSLDVKRMLIGFAGIFTTHIVYGLWFIKGLLTRKLPEEK
jgi:glycosyltransferase involved in cell wall biosynthesis